MEIPLPYKIILQELKDRAFENEVEIKKVRYVIVFRFKLGKQNFTHLIQEMTKLGLVDYKDHKTLLIK